MRDLHKVIYLLNIDDYEPELRKHTRPFVEQYAEKIRAQIFDITKRKFPDWPVVYEKLQIQELAREHEVDWAIYFDSDALIHPNTPDFTSLIHKDVVLHNGNDFAPVRWCYDEYMLRDGRHIGSCDWLAIASDWCLDLWTPLDISLDEALAHIYPTTLELASGVIEPSHLIDDYTLSRNIARYGLKYQAIAELTPGGGWFWHTYDVDRDEKLRQMEEVLTFKSWGGSEPDPE